MFKHMLNQYSVHRYNQREERFERRKKQMTYENITKQQEKRAIRVRTVNGHTRYDVKRMAALPYTLKHAPKTFIWFWFMLIASIVFEMIGRTIGGLEKNATLDITLPFLIVTFAIGLFYATQRYRYVRTHMRFIVARKKQHLVKELLAKRTEQTTLQAKERAMLEDVQDNESILFAPSLYEQVYGAYRNDIVENEPMYHNPFNEHVVTEQLETFKRFCQLEDNGQLHRYANMMKKVKRRTTKEFKNILRDVFLNGGYDRNEVITAKEGQIAILANEGLKWTGYDDLGDAPFESANLEPTNVDDKEDDKPHHENVIPFPKPMDLFPNGQEPIRPKKPTSTK